MNNNKSARKLNRNSFQKKTQRKNHAEASNEMAIHNHLTNFDNISLDSSSDSASGKSDFDEEYYKNKPEAIELRNSQIIEVDNNKGFKATDESYHLPPKRNDRTVKKYEDDKSLKKPTSYSTDTTLVLHEENEKECCCWNIICFFWGN